MFIRNRRKRAEMKKTLIISLCILFILAVFADAKQSTQKPARTDDIAVTLISQIPDPAEPGSYVDVRFKFDNNGSGEAANVEAEILPEYPFSLYEEAEKGKSLGTIQSRQKGDVGVIVKHRLRVDENAIEGKNEISIRYRIDKGVWVEPEEFFVDVQTHDAILSVDSVSMVKSMIEPGSSNNLNIRLLNNADSVLKDIQVRLALASLPFAPLDSTNEKSIYQIGSKASYEVSFKLLANPDAKAGVYQVPLDLIYSDELGKKYIKNNTIGIIVGSRPELSVTLDKSEIYEEDKSGEIIVKVVNKGVTDIKFANLKIIPAPDYKILSSDEVYLGNIDSDDFETAGFRIFVSNVKKNEIDVPLSLEYKDANNNEYKDNVALNLGIYSASDAKKFGLKKGNGVIGNIIVLIIVAVGLFYYIRFRKKKKKA